MQASDVVELLDVFEHCGLEVYVDGGWAVEALARRSRRSKSFLAAEAIAAFVEAESR